VAINELLGKPDSFGIMVASQIDTILDMAVWTHDESAVILHCGSSYIGGRRPIQAPRAISQAVGYEKITPPVQRAASAIFLLQLRNFSRLAQVAALELAAPDKQNSDEPDACGLRRYANRSAPAAVNFT
jgi:hypothetical protein